MRSILLALVAALTLAACAAQPPLSGAAPGRAQMVGTLASFGTFEMELAPAYTRLAVLRHRAAGRLTAGRIDVATARQVQAQADDARARLDAAHSATLAGQVPASARDNLAEARRLIEAGEALLEPK